MCVWPGDTKPDFTHEIEGRAQDFISPDLRREGPWQTDRLVDTVRSLKRSWPVVRAQSPLRSSASQGFLLHHQDRPKHPAPQTRSPDDGRQGGWSRGASLAEEHCSKCCPSV